MTKVFIYKGIVGIQSEETSDALIAKPVGGNLGCVCDASKVKISKEALDALKTIPKGHDGLGEIDVFKSGDMIVFSWLGGYLKAFKPNEIETSRDYNPNLLTHSEDVDIPKEFIDFVDSQI
jgi:hypothetical protein